MNSNQENPRNPEVPFDEDDDITSHEELTEEELSSEVTSPQPLGEPQILEKNLGLVKFFDYICANPLNLIYQPKLITKYHNELVVPLVGTAEIPPENADRGRMFLRDEYYDQNIEEKAKKIIDVSETVARGNGYRTSINKRFSIAQLIITTLSIGGYFLLATIWDQYGTYFLIGSMLLMCFGAQGVRTFLQKHWENFQKTFLPVILEQTQSDVDEVKGFVQSVLDDTRDRLLTQSLPLEKVQFSLLSNDYHNVVFVRNQATQKGAPLTAVYQFKYPEGMGPKTTTVYGETPTVQENDNDEFMIFQSAVFNDDGQLETYSIKKAPEELAHQIELLLNVSQFTSVDNPESVIPTFGEIQTDISCSCDDPIRFKAMKSCTSPLHNNFEFYMIICHPCECSVSPYILFSSPGNRTVPDGLKPIFM